MLYIAFRSTVVERAQNLRKSTPAYARLSSFHAWFWLNRLLHASIGI